VSDPDHQGVPDQVDHQSPQEAVPENLEDAKFYSYNEPRESRRKIK
jgi:hypothetical protein